MILFKEIPIPMCDDWVLDVIICNTPSKMPQFMRKRYGWSIESWEEDQQSFTWPHVTTINKKISGGTERIPVLFLRKKIDHVVVHELIHVMWRLHELIELEMTISSQEYQARMFETLYREVMKNNYKKIK